ncbi:MAG: PKD domain-containing protein, partial [Bacteroidia bacterium]|nr:PKD domain-containing protein [Bacteroidia bacterium]
KSTITKFLFVSAICFLSLSVYTYTNTPPAAQTGAPGESNCTSCHGGSPITSGTNWNAIALTGLPSGGYAANTTYSITLSGNAASTSKNGFQITCLTSTNAMAGSFAAGTGSTIVTNGGISYITQSGNTSGLWTFNWTSPSTALGAVTFYVSFNGSNSNSNSSGDAIYTKTFTLNQTIPNLPTAVITPSSNTVCLGDTLYLAGSGINNPTSFNWQFLNNTPNSASTQNVKLIYTTVGTKTIRLTTSNGNGNSPQTTINVTVVAKPTASITASSSTICGNDSISLETNTGTGLTYLWTPGNFTTSSFYVKDSVSYSVKVTNLMVVLLHLHHLKLPKPVTLKQI